MQYLGPHEQSFDCKTSRPFCPYRRYSRGMTLREKPLRENWREAERWL
jgi:hypothetical protein